MKPEEAIGIYLEQLEHERRLSPLTLTVYRHELELFADYLRQAAVEEVGEISHREARQWQAMRMEEGLAPRSIQKMLCALRGWNKFLRRKGWTAQDFMARTVVPKAAKKQPVFFKEREVERIYDADIFAEDFNGQRDRLLLRLLYETGIRRAEAAGLTLSSVDRSAKRLKVLGKRNKERYIPIEDELIAAIDGYVGLRSAIACQDDHLLVSENGKALSVNQIYHIVRRYMSVLSNADHSSPHVFRHTFATHILNEGGNIMAIKELLGHSSLDATEIYTHVTREHLKATYRQAHPRATS